MTVMPLRSSSRAALSPVSRNPVQLRKVLENSAEREGTPVSAAPGRPAQRTESSVQPIFPEYALPALIELCLVHIGQHSEGLHKAAEAAALEKLSGAIGVIGDLFLPQSLADSVDVFRLAHQDCDLRVGNLIFMADSPYYYF